MEPAYYSTLVKVALTKDSESTDPVQNLDQVIPCQKKSYQVTVLLPDQVVGHKFWQIMLGTKQKHY